MAAVHAVRYRQLFWGSLLANNSWHALGIAALEGHRIFHTAAFVESNHTQTFALRRRRFNTGSVRLGLLPGGMFGDTVCLF
jgi:hypothetical protein